jgi:hypothetical protein
MLIAGGVLSLDLRFEYSQSFMEEKVVAAITNGILKVGVIEIKRATSQAQFTPEV